MEKRIGKEIKYIDILVARYIAKHIKSENQYLLSPVQINIMEYLDKAEEIVYQKDLEKEMQVRKSTLSGILRTMEKNGIVDKIEAKNDFRSRQIQLTEKGRKVYKETISEIIKMENLLAENISDQDLDVFFKVLEQIKNNLKDS